MEAIMTSTMNHCWVRKLCAWVCKKCAPCAPYFAHLNAYPRNFMCVYNNGIIVDVIIASQMYYIWASHSQFTRLLDSKRRLTSGVIFAREKTSVYKPCTNKLELFFGTLSWSTIHVELFWVTFDPSVATLSINTLCLWVRNQGTGSLWRSLWRRLYSGTSL